MTHKYYSILRPVSIGTHPKDGMIKFRNYDSRVPVPSIDRSAWGEIIYNRELSEKELHAYDLAPEKKPVLTGKPLIVEDLDETEDNDSDEYPSYIVTFTDGSTYEGVTCECGEGCDGTDYIANIGIGTEFRDFDEFIDNLR